MNNDRELLELAAKAAGIEIFFDTDDDCYRIKASGNRHYWNPIHFDGDALRLAATLRLRAGSDGQSLNPTVRCWRARYDQPDIYEPEGDDIYAATRRAIVRAAAEIGRNMKMNHREVMQQALDALDFTDSAPGSIAWEREKDACEALRAALAEPEQDVELSAALGWPGGISTPILDRHVLLDIVAKQRSAALAEFDAEPTKEEQTQIESKQEPVAWRVLRSDGQYELYFVKASAERAAECYISRPQVEPLYTHPAPQRQPQEPTIDGYPLWSGMPQRQPLSDVEIETAYREIWRGLPSDFDHTSAGWIEQGIRYAERKHGIGGQDE